MREGRDSTFFLKGWRRTFLCTLCMGSLGGKILETLFFDKLYVAKFNPLMSGGNKKVAHT